jgi:hypothetical protein
LSTSTDSRWRRERKTANRDLCDQERFLSCYRTQSSNSF